MRALRFGRFGRRRCRLRGELGERTAFLLVRLRTRGTSDLEAMACQEIGRVGGSAWMLAVINSRCTAKGVMS